MIIKGIILEVVIELDWYWLWLLLYGYDEVVKKKKETFKNGNVDEYRQISIQIKNYIIVAFIFLFVVDKFC